MMKIDIAICTWNRAKLLQNTLRSLAAIEIPTNVAVNVIVVDNNSDDATSEVLESFQRKLESDPAFAGRVSAEILFESQQGHTFSRNRAVHAAQGDLILWTDDDVDFDRHWLKSYVRAAENREFVFWGGKIIPTFVESQPDWIAENWDSIKGCFAERDLGDQVVELTPQRLPYGANFAIRTEVQKQYLFDTELGRRRESVLGEDESDLFRRLLHDGYRGRWVAESILRHVISPERADERYVRDYFIGQGRALVKKSAMWTTNQRKLFWQMVYEFAQYRFKRHWAKSPAWMAHLIRSGLAEGQYHALNDKVG